MPIKIPNQLPATSVLTSENIFVMTETRAITQDIRPLQSLLLNLMPTKVETETQLARVLGNTPIQIELELIAPSGHVSKNTSQAHMLGDGPGLRHDEDILRCQDGGGGQLVGNFDGHVTSPAPGPGRCHRSGPVCPPGRSSSGRGPRGCRRRQAARRSSAGGWSWRGSDSRSGRRLHGSRWRPASDRCV